MRRSVVAALTLVLLAAPPAPADHHFMQVTEVAPGGAQANQFIELRDPASESFPSTSEYSVAATNAAGAIIPGATQTLQPEPLRFTTEPFVLGGASVSPQDAALNFAIPPEAARVCFYRGGAQINCLAYGGITIPAGQSAQRQSCGAVAAAAPTPDADNTETGACGGGAPPPPGGGPGGGGPGGGGPAEDLTPPQQKLGGKRRQDVDRLAVGVTLNEAGRVTVRARVNVPGAARVLRFRTASRSVAANTPVRVRLRLARKPRRAVKAALADGERLSARITITARDPAGNPSTARKRVRLTD